MADGLSDHSSTGGVFAFVLCVHMYTALPTVPGGAAGKLVCGWLGDRLDIVGLIWGTKGLTAVLLGLSLLTPPIAMAPLMVVLGIGLNGTSSVLYATVAEFVPPRRRARLYGMYYTTNEGGTVAAPLIFGIIADLYGLEIAIVTMSLATAVILPASVALRKFVRPKEESFHMVGG